jgi:hypothetical protein
MDRRKTGWVGMTLIDLTKDRDRWRVPVNMAMDLPFPRKHLEFLE